jgi:hypothetical protein
MFPVPERKGKEIETDEQILADPITRILRVKEIERFV